MPPPNIAMSTHLCCVAHWQDCPLESVRPYRSAKCRYWPRLCKKGVVSAPCAEHCWHSCSERQFLPESILGAPGTLPVASAGIDLNAQHPPAQVTRASSSPVTPMIAMTRLML